MKKTVIAGLAALMMGLGAITFAGPGNAVPEPSLIAGQIMVKFRDDASAAGVLRRHGLSDGPGIGSTGVHLIAVPDGKELQLIDALSRNPAVEYAEPDLVVTAATNDQYFPSQYALQNVGQPFTNTKGDIKIAAGTADADVDAVEAWTFTTGSGIKVAVLDSGVANDNPDINPKVAARANFTNGETGDDNYGHGTHVAGIVAASHNTQGVAGTCPACTILDGKVLNDSGIGSSSGLADGINWAVSNGAKVINMSLGVRASRTLETAVNNAWSKGVVLVAAAGNGGNQTKIYPGAYPNVIAVGATDNFDNKASFSTYGASWVDVAAPGANVYSTFPNHEFVLRAQYNRSLGYDVGNGTSMSSAVVAATAALAWSSHPGATNISVRANVELTAEKITGQDSYWEHGRVNACKAVGGCP
ncbi:S8 family serine peptidase [Pseudarthrobacter cellobiosi]|uniref:S8 family serine peptidase n=1 Tax=Pseudarthrobacter cellobiosi TaxID=2953654 RepID=UPI00208FC515|nr:MULTISPECIES: S8 family serine peptidase [unclassified Pseudarthrobacter]MCO4253810.1 S8 family serine peptidase [Pseudarthrobacter sp. HLT1-5]MCO4272866.1 S8 family serine peptidase [Pseudarthrobacter sp. HLT3-5]